ncbi:MAG: hypothetical protein GX427_13195 [Actinomycetales bacterium]|nr:hypothetical protein [Actinomycetales bacterium]
MTDVVISPSSQTANQYAGGATGVEDSESRHMRDIAPLWCDLLLRNGVDALILWSADLATRVKESNKIAPLLHGALHSNAGGSSLGAGCFVYQRGTKSEVMAREIQRELAAITPWPDLGVIQYNHYETRETTSYAVIMEVAFHDKAESAEWIRTHKREIAVALTRGTINALAAAYGGRFTEIAARPLLLDGGGGMGPVVTEPAPGVVIPAPVPAPAPVPSLFPLLVDGDWGPITTKGLQTRLGKLLVDGVFGPITVRRLQAYLGGLYVDGDFGPKTKRALQARLGVVVDGWIGPVTVKALQTRLNKGAL